LIIAGNSTYVVNHHQERKQVSGQNCNALVDKNTVKTEVKWLPIKYITSKGVLMLPIQQTTMYSNLVTNGREVDEVMHMTGQVVYCILDKRGLTNLLGWFSHNCTASLKKLNVLVL